MVATEAHSVVQSARYKLNSEASRPNSSLRIMVGHANFLDSLLIHLYNEGDEIYSRRVAANIPTNLPTELTTIEEMELDEDDDSGEAWDQEKSWRAALRNENASHKDERYEIDNEYDDEDYPTESDGDEESTEEESENEDKHTPESTSSSVIKSEQQSSKWHAPFTQLAAKARSTIVVSRVNSPIPDAPGQGRPYAGHTASLTVLH